ncbi:MAG: SGNH/GDSL hydrolase family protein [Saprospiraceae bacterium]|nr:SGNH/GDSL hydrolase family protein [Saprospiraceae bacterium]
MKSLLFVFPLMACFLLSFSPAKKKMRVVFFGDSITEAGVQPGGYIAQMRDTLVAENKGEAFDLVGAGISGNKVYDLYLRLETDVLAKKPKVVVIYVGVNDVWHKQTHGTGTDADKFKKFYDAIIAKLQKKGIQVIMCTPACIGEKKGGVNPLDKELDTYSDIIRGIAKEKNCKLVDLRKAFTEYNAANNISDRYSSILTTDGVHLNAKGNKMVAEMILAAMEEMK